MQVQPGVLQIDARVVVACPQPVLILGCLHTITSYIEQQVKEHSMGAYAEGLSYLVYGHGHPGDPSTAHIAKIHYQPPTSQKGVGG